MEEIENRRRKLLQQLPVKTRVSGFGDLPNLRREILPDAGNRAQLVFVEKRETFRRVSDRLGRISIGAYLERVFVLDFEQISDLRKDMRDG